MANDGWVLTAFSRYCPDCLYDTADLPGGPVWDGAWRLPHTFLCERHNRILARAMEDIRREGLAKAIGVANFYPDRLIDLIVNNEITPAANQIETHPFFQRADYQDVMREHAVQIQSWGGFAEGKNDLFTNPVLAVIDGNNSSCNRSTISSTAPNCHPNRPDHGLFSGDFRWRPGKLRRHSAWPRHRS